MRGWALLAIAALTLSGCSGGGGGGGDSQEANGIAQAGNQTLAPPPPVATTDTLWFVEAPAMATVAPRNPIYEEAMPVSGFLFFDGRGQGPEDGVWEHTLDAPGTVTGGTLHAWLDVAEALYNPPYAPDSGLPGQQTQCTWRADVVIEFVGSPIGEALGLCVNDSAPTIPTGDLEVEFEFDFGETVVLEGNATLRVALSRQPFSASQNDAVYVISGTPEYDTWIRLDGLREPVE